MQGSGDAGISGQLLPRLELPNVLDLTARNIDGFDGVFWELVDQMRATLLDCHRERALILELESVGFLEEPYRAVLAILLHLAHDLHRLFDPLEHFELLRRLLATILCIILVNDLGHVSNK